MESDNFDSQEAKKFLLQREREGKEAQEKERQQVLQLTVSFLRQEFEQTSVEIYLVGSILRPFAFTPQSDIDVVLKNYHGDRFDCWTKLEKKLGRRVEVILFESCPFQEFVVKDGLKVV